MADWMSCTPLDILAVAIGEFGIDSEIGDNLFSAYDRFLGMVADPSNRKRLNQLRAEESRTDSVFREVRKISDKFAEALRRIFFESPNLSRLTQKYGVF